MFKSSNWLPLLKKERSLFTFEDGKTGEKVSHICKKLPAVVTEGGHRIR
jgi:hypothetical protein